MLGRPARRELGREELELLWGLGQAWAVGDKGGDGLESGEAGPKALRHRTSLEYGGSQGSSC